MYIYIYISPSIYTYVGLGEGGAARTAMCHRRRRCGAWDGPQRVPANYSILNKHKKSEPSPNTRT